MKNLSDEILNKYIDGELDYNTSQEVQRILSTSDEDRKQFQSLLAVHDELKKLKAEQVHETFTNLVMNRIRLQKKSYKEQKTFITVVSSIFALMILIILGILVYLGISQSQGSENSVSISQNVVAFMQSLVSLISQIFTPKGMSIFGSIISLGILITGYFFFENLRTAKQKVHKTR